MDTAFNQILVQNHLSRFALQFDFKDFEMKNHGDRRKRQSY